MVMDKMQKGETRGFKTPFHKPMCDTTATTSTSYIQSVSKTQRQYAQQTTHRQNQ